MLSKFDEIKLIALCMATDNREAFSRLVEAYQADVKRFLFSLTGGDALLTDDLAQETFIKAWMAIREFKGLSGFKTWIFRIAVHEFISYRRKRFVDSEISISGYEDYSQISAGEYRPHDGIEAKLDMQTLLGMLPENERIVCLLFYLEDLPVKKISKILSLPEGTVKSHLSRARKHLSEINKM